MRFSLVFKPHAPGRTSAGISKVNAVPLGFLFGIAGIGQVVGFLPDATGCHDRIKHVFVLQQLPLQVQKYTFFL